MQEILQRRRALEEKLAAARAADALITRTTAALQPGAPVEDTEALHHALMALVSVARAHSGFDACLSIHQVRIRVVNLGNRQVDLQILDDTDKANAAGEAEMKSVVSDLVDLLREG